MHCTACTSVFGQRGALAPRCCLICQAVALTGWIFSVSNINTRTTTAVCNPCLATAAADDLHSPELQHQECKYVCSVVICGAGIIGSAIAYYLAMKGVAATVVERASVACASSGKRFCIFAASTILVARELAASVSVGQVECCSMLAQ